MSVPMPNDPDGRPGRPRLPWALKRHKVVVHVAGETIAAFQLRYGQRNWRAHMGTFLDAAAKGWSNSRKDHEEG